MLQVLANGVALGAVYALVAAGFVLVYRATRVFNLAQGAFMAPAAYVTSALVIDHGLPFGLAVLGALALMAMIGAATHLLLLRPLIGSPITSSIMVTLGLLIVIESVVEIQWGGNSYALPTPWQLEPIVLPGGVRTTNFAVATVVVAVVVIFALVAFFRFTRTGTRMRAAAADPLLASISGINLTLCFAAAWAVGGVLAGIAGISFASVTLVSPSLITLGIRALPAVLLGGLDSLAGALLGGMVLGVAESWAVDAFGAEIADVTVFAILLLALTFRPNGLLGRARAARL